MTVLDTKVKSFNVPWDGQLRQLSVPRDNLVAELLMTDLPPVDDAAQTLIDACEAPIGSKPLPDLLRPGMKLALLTGDRVTDVMLGVRDGLGVKILDYLNRLGIRDEDITLVHAGGSHYNPDWAARFGEALTSRITCLRHDAWDEANLRFVGVTQRATPVWVNRVVTEADFVLGIGEVSPNSHGGWTGGGKMIVPGVAGMDTIEQNHSYVMRPLNTLGLADGNQMRVDMEEGARLAGLDFKIDILIDSQGRVVKAYAGDFYAEHRAALPMARQIWMTKLDPVDVMVIHPGERGDRYLGGSMFIRFEAADLALKEDGIIIHCLSAAGGWNAPEAVERQQSEPAATMKLSLDEMARAMVRKQGNMRNVSICYLAKRALQRHRTFLVCDGISKAEAAEFGFAHCTPSFDEALAMALHERGKAATIATNISRGLAWRMTPWRIG